MNRKDRVAAWLLMAAALGALVVLVVRVTSWESCWRWSITEGRESPGIYAIWRLLHGHELYEWPTRPPYSVTLYNFGFYEAYAGLARLFGVDGERLLGAPRALTFAGACVGCAAFLRVALALSPPRERTTWGALVALAFVVWFGTQFVSWWVVSVRPDVWAVAFAVVGLTLTLTPWRGARVASLLAAALAFFLAWTFKQSCILTFGGLVLGLLALRRFGDVLWLAVPYATLVALCLLLGGEAYRFNLLGAPAASAWRLSLLTQVLARAVPQNLWIFAFFPSALLLASRGRLRAGFRALSESDRLVVGAAALAMALGAVALGREGSNKNHLFEGYVLAALASWSAWSRQAGGGSRGLGMAGNVLLVPLALFPLAQLVGVPGSGRIVLCTASDAHELERMARAVSELPKPLFSDEEIFALPWHSSEGRYPALVLDSTWFGLAAREGVLERGFVGNLLGSGRFRSALFIEGHPELLPLQARGAECGALAGMPFGLRFVGCRLPEPPARSE